MDNTMKKILIALITITAMSCNDFDIADQGFDLEALPESVSFNGDGDNINADDSGDEGDKVTLEVEAPNGTLEPIVVTYSLGGTATFGEDYTIDGATATGGTVTIDLEPDIVNDFDDGEIEIMLLNDRENGEDDETVVITLESATRGDESVEVGRGGTDYGKTATITIGDVPFTFNFNKGTPSGALATSERLVKDTLTFSAQLNFATDVDVTYTLEQLTAVSSLLENTNFAHVTGESTVTPGDLTIPKGKTMNTIQVVIIDNAEASTTAFEGRDSIQYRITNASVPSGDIWIGNNASTAADTVAIFVFDDVAGYGFSVTSDTIKLTEVTTYNYSVTLVDTVTNAPIQAFSDVVIPYTTSEGTAVAATDFNDVTGGSVTIPKGKSSTNISIQILQVGLANDPVVTVKLGAPTTSYAEVLGVTAMNTLHLKID